MSDTTPNLQLPFIAAAQAQKHVTHNEAIRALDALVQLAVVTRSQAVPPLSPAEGSAYIPAQNATGDWLGRDDTVAAFQDGAWAFYVPRPGWRAWIGDEALLAAWDGTTWVAAANGTGGASVNPAALVGVNTTADATNKLAVKSDAILLSHDDVTPGSGNHRVVVNKAAAGNTAGFVFQDGYSGRAEIGLTGDDDFHFKTSLDGAAWSDALVLVGATGTPKVPTFTQAALPSPASAGPGAIVFVSDATPPTLAVSDGTTWHQLGGSGSFNGTFTDELADGVGTPVAITTSIATRQAWQRGRANIVLGGTYDVTGGVPSGMAWRVGAGPWVQFASEAIGAGNWQGTLDIPADYLAQGTFEVKPINGLNVTPAQFANITISDIFAFAGQSNIDQATNPQTYARTTFDWTNKPFASAWESRTVDSWTGGTTTGSFAPALAEVLDQAGIPPVTHVVAQADGTGFASGDWNPGDTLYGLFKSRLAAEIGKTGGYAALCFVFGENDSTGNQSVAGWKAAAGAMLDDLVAAAPELANTRIMWPVLGEHGGAGLDAVRQGIIEMVTDDARVFDGPNLVNFNWGDGTHYGIVGGHLDTAGATAQLDAVGAHYARALRQLTPAAPKLLSIAIGTGADADKVFISFDRAMENHADATGFAVSDGGGAALASSTPGATAADLVLTCTQAFYGQVTVSYGAGNTAIDGTFREAAAVAGVKMAPEPFLDAPAGTGVGAAPALNSAPTLSSTANVGSVLNGNDGSYSGIPAPSVGAYQWQRSDDGATGWTDIAGATAASYTVQGADDTKYLRRGEVATNPVGSAPRAYTAASAQVTSSTETVVFDLASDGTATGIIALFSAVLAGAQADSDGGSDAISITDGNLGTTGATGVRTGLVTVNNGDTIVRAKFKTVSAAAAEMWVRVRPVGTDQASYVCINITDDATPGASRVGVNTGWTSATMTDLGGGWWGFESVIDMTGADLSGNFYLEFGDADGDTSISRNGTNTVLVHDWTGSYV